MAQDLIVIGASSGGVEALQTVAASLPAKLNASIFVVIHVTADGPALMAGILDRRGPLQASYPRDGQPFEHGEIYVAPPDHHLLLEGSRMRLARGPKESRHRPAIDPLFRSAAAHHGARVIGVVLTGYQADGASGLAAIKEHGGITVVQDPLDAAVPDMPRNALKRVAADYCLPLFGIAPLLVGLASALPPVVHDMHS